MSRHFVLSLATAFLAVMLLANLAHGSQPDFVILQVELRHTPPVAADAAPITPSDTAPPQPASQPATPLEPPDATTPVVAKQLIRVGEPYSIEITVDGTIIVLRGQTSGTAAGPLQAEVRLRVSKPVQWPVDGQPAQTRWGVREVAATLRLPMGEWTKVGASGAGPAGTDTWFVRVIAPGDDLSK